MTENELKEPQLVTTLRRADFAYSAEGEVLCAVVANDVYIVYGLHTILEMYRV